MLIKDYINYAIISITQSYNGGEKNWKISILDLEK